MRRIQNLRKNHGFDKKDSIIAHIKTDMAEEMQDLLELAAEKRARRILEVAHRIGLKATDSSTKKFEDELGGL